MDPFGLNDPFFKPLWRRVAVVVACLGWAFFELQLDNPGWAILFGAIGGIAAWGFFISFNPPQDNESGNNGTKRPDNSRK